MQGHCCQCRRISVKLVKRGPLPGSCCLVCLGQDPNDHCQASEDGGVGQEEVVTVVNKKAARQLTLLLNPYSSFLVFLPSSNGLPPLPSNLHTVPGRDIYQ